jgi:hypothetical protein
MSEKIPTWGYGKDGPKLFELDEGESLPSGYYDHPDKMEEAETKPAKPVLKLPADKSAD